MARWQDVKARAIREFQLDSDEEDEFDDEDEEDIDDVDEAIAEQHGAKVFGRKLDRFDVQRNYAREQATCDWILSIDADETVTLAHDRRHRRRLEVSPPNPVLRNTGGYFVKPTADAADCHAPHRPTRVLRNKGAYFVKPHADAASRYAPSRPTRGFAK